MATTPRTTFHDTSLQVRTVVEVFDFLSPKETPFLKMISSGSEEKPSLNSLSKPCQSKKFEWIEETDPPFITALGADLDGSSTNVTVTAAHAQFFPPGTVFKIDDEYFLVALTTTLANPVVVITRPYAGSVATTHANGSVVTIIGQASLEEKDFKESWTNEVTLPFNYTQLYEDMISVTEMAQAIAQYGADDALERETARKTRRMMRLLNRSAFMGKRYAGTAAIPAMMGGLDYFIPAVNTTDLLGGTLETNHVEDLMRTVFDSVGASNVPDTIICNSLVRTRINKIFSNSGVITYRDQKERRGGVLIDYIDTHFGSFDIMVDHDCPPETAYLVKAEKLGIGPLVDMAFKRVPLAQTGPVTRFGLYGAYTLQVLGSMCHAKITNIAQSNL